MATKTPVKSIRLSESSDLQYTKPTPQLSGLEMSPLVSSGVGIRSMEPPSNITTPSNTVPPKERNIDGLRYKMSLSKMSPSRLSDEEQMIQILTALHKINFPKTGS